MLPVPAQQFLKEGLALANVKALPASPATQPGADLLMCFLLHESFLFTRRIEKTSI